MEIIKHGNPKSKAIKMVLNCSCGCEFSFFNYEAILRQYSGYNSSCEHYYIKCPTCFVECRYYPMQPCLNGAYYDASMRP